MPNSRRPGPHPPRTRNCLNFTFYRANPFSPLTNTKTNHLPNPASNPPTQPNPHTRPCRNSRRIRLRFRHASQIKMRNSFILSMAPTVHYPLPKEKSL
jgi:hypothetical protein